MSNQKFILTENLNYKIFRSPSYNFIFNKSNGLFIRWGRHKKEDPIFSKFGPEILDIEISTICKGGCKFCYKNNTPIGKNMSFETFKTILDKILLSNKCLTQIALGSGETATENPDIWKIMKYCRKKGIIPNITVANIDDKTADNIVKYVGACAVSRYSEKNKCYESVYKLTSRGLKQTNIHLMICEQTYEQAIETISDIKTDKRLKDLNAIVFLSLKKKGRAEKDNFETLNQEKFNKLINLCLEKNINWGVDSCGANKTLEAIKNNPNRKEMEISIEPCESCLFSFYINVDGKGFPCSFVEKTLNWNDGIDIIKTNNFLNDVWFNQRTIDFRNRLIKNNRECLIYSI